MLLRAPPPFPSPNQCNAMPGGYWSLLHTKSSRARSAISGAAATAENYRYRDAQLGMVSGKWVKCLDRAVEEGESVRWGNDRAAIFKLISGEEAEEEWVRRRQVLCAGILGEQMCPRGWVWRHMSPQTIRWVTLQLGRRTTSRHRK